MLSEMSERKLKNIRKNNLPYLCKKYNIKVLKNRRKIFISAISQ
ncbi:hypothetical protein HMPREF1548_03059 [Clostridium sp. KLE 1755]|nr:hypothetical protein HMPREF1548_03059 [Clostridium sp. KLE 1755]